MPVFQLLLVIVTPGPCQVSNAAACDVWSLSEPGGSLWPFWLGCVIGVAPWLAIGVYLWSPGSSAEPPAFVYAIFGSLFVFFNVFALNMWLQYRRVGRWRSYLFGEKAYMVLSLVAKSLLAWQVFAGTLAG